jgi:hypothetical protein
MQDRAKRNQTSAILCMVFSTFYLNPNKPEEKKEKQQ